MREHIHRIAAGAAIALGMAHLLYGILVFKALTVEHIWFAGAGVAMVCVGLTSWRGPARLEAIIMTAYLGVMVIRLPLPQVFLGVAIFLTLIVTGRSMRKV